MTVAVPETLEITTPRWRGINHLALITTDMDATVRFYHGVLGARLVATIGTPEFRHYFFELGPQKTLSGMISRTVVGAVVRNLDTAADAQGFAAAR